MASGSILSEVILEEKLVELWPEYTCLYDVSSTEFKNRDRREVAMSEIAEKLGQNGRSNLHQIMIFLELARN